jgi:hypothetical protein
LGNGTRDEAGVALALVAGIIMILFLGTSLMVTNVLQHFPMVQQDAVQHEAYRAMIAGVDEYLSEVNSDPEYVMCNAVPIYAGQLPTAPSAWPLEGNSTVTGALCNELSLAAWTAVPNVSANYSVPAWFRFGTPSIYSCTGVGSACPTPQTWEDVKVVGAAGYTNDMSYDVAEVQFDPTNGFLVNLWWLNYDQSDPVTLGDATAPDCGYYWNGGLVGGNPTDCTAIVIDNGESIDGNLFLNDSLFECGTPHIAGNTQTADPGHAYIAYPSGCGAEGAPNPTSWAGHGVFTDNAHAESPPTDDAVLGTVAVNDGCEYMGPTEIKFALNGGVGGMDVYSPDTPLTGGVDSLSGPNDTSTCYNSVTGWGGWVPLPANGVVYVTGCTGPPLTTCSYTPLGATPATSVYTPDDSYESVGASEGDAIVEGVLQGQLTVAAENNVVISGDICYESWTTSALPCQEAPAGVSTDVLALVAYNFVELNHYVDGSGRDNHPCTGGTGTSPVDGGAAPYQQATYSTNSGTAYTDLQCDVDDPVIDAAILALNHQFDVHNFDQGNNNNLGTCGRAETYGCVYIFGSLAEDWRGPVGVTGTSGYDKEYTYDTRLGYLSPPDYLNPGTDSWGLSAMSSSRMTCTAAGVSCAYP